MPLTTFVASFSYSGNAFFESVRTSENFNARDCFFFTLEIVEIDCYLKQSPRLRNTNFVCSKVNFKSLVESVCSPF